MYFSNIRVNGKRYKASKNDSVNHSDPSCYRLPVALSVAPTDFVAPRAASYCANYNYYLICACSTYPENVDQTNLRVCCKG